MKTLDRESYFWVKICVAAVALMAATAVAALAQYADNIPVAAVAGTIAVLLFFWLRNAGENEITRLRLVEEAERAAATRFQAQALRPVNVELFDIRDRFSTQQVRKALDNIEAQKVAEAFSKPPQWPRHK